MYSNLFHYISESYLFQFIDPWTIHVECIHFLVRVIEKMGEIMGNGERRRKKEIGKRRVCQELSEISETSLSVGLVL